MHSQTTARSRRPRDLAQPFPPYLSKKQALFDEQASPLIQHAQQGVALGQVPLGGEFRG